MKHNNQYFKSYEITISSLCLGLLGCLHQRGFNRWLKPQAQNKKKTLRIVTQKNLIKLDNHKWRQKDSIRMNLKQKPDWKSVISSPKDAMVSFFLRHFHCCYLYSLLLHSCHCINDYSDRSGQNSVICPQTCCTYLPRNTLLKKLHLQHWVQLLQSNN